MVLRDGGLTRTERELIESESLDFELSFGCFQVQTRSDILRR